MEFCMKREDLYFILGLGFSGSMIFVKGLGL